MSKVITDSKMIDELLSRGVEKIYPSVSLLKKKLMTGEPIKLYCGYDPSAPSLHIGHAISFNKLSQFQKLGHQVIFLIGDFTGMIGDPTDKTAARKKLSREEVLKNSKEYQKQGASFLSFSGDNSAKLMYNSEWNDKLTFKDLIELSSNFTVQQMIQRDMFQERLKEEKPIYLHEFMYPLAQGYDSYAMDVDLEVGGNDQMFNMMRGRDLQKNLRNKEKFVMTLKLLADDSGKKMGKSEGNAVFLDEKANDMFGKIMSWSDGLIINAFELCTQVPMSEIKKMKQQMINNEVNPRDLKMKLAYEIVKIFHNESSAQMAQDYFINTFQKKEIPDEIIEVKIKGKNRKIVDLLVEGSLVESKGEARRLIEQGGIKIDGQVIREVNMEVNLKEGMIIQRGKRQFIKITLI
jgi:tyrosyl-tRNA synthetase